MFFNNWGLNLNNAMFTMASPYSFGYVNPFIMRFNMIQSVIGNMLNGSRNCNCNCQYQFQYSQPVFQQPIQLFNNPNIQHFDYTSIQPMFDNSQFENYMTKQRELLNQQLAAMFQQNYQINPNINIFSNNITSNNKLNFADTFSNAYEQSLTTSASGRKFGTATAKINTVNNSTKIVINKNQITDIVHEKALKYGVDERLILAIIGQESSFINGRTSSKGAKGLMQLMPATAKELGITDVNDPEQNIDGGVRLIKKFLEIYNGDVKKALAAYNSGMGNVNDILNGTNKCKHNPQHIKDPSGIPRIKETQNYVEKIYNNYKNYTVA